LDRGEYVRNLRSAVGTSAAPYGFTLAVWSTGAITTSFRSTPGPPQVLVFVTGVLLAFAIVGALAYGGVRGYSGGERHSVELWGNFHIPAVGLTVAVTTLTGYLVSNGLAWFLCPFLATSTYLIMLGLEFSIAEEKEPEQQQARSES
jgi:hypothetical protein